MCESLPFVALAQAGARFAHSAVEVLGPGLCRGDENP